MPIPNVTLYPQVTVRHSNYHEDGILHCVCNGTATVRLHFTGFVHVPLDDVDFCVARYLLRPHPRAQLTSHEITEYERENPEPRNGRDWAPRNPILDPEDPEPFDEATGPLE